MTDGARKVLVNSRYRYSIRVHMQSIFVRPQEGKGTQEGRKI